MSIKLEVTKENEDGSAEAVVHFDKEGLEILIQAGITKIILDYIEQQKPVKTYAGGKPNRVRK